MISVISSDFGGFHGDFIHHTQPRRFFLTLTYPKWPYKGDFGDFHGDFGGDLGFSVYRGNEGISRNLNCDHMLFQNTKWQPTAPQVAPLAV